MRFLPKYAHFQLAIVCGVLLNAASCGHHDKDIDDECVWEESTNPGNNPPSVKNTRSECTRGKLIWHHPYGGLRVSFQPIHIKGAFKLCFTSKHPGINIFREGFKDLTLLKGSHDLKAKERICLHSANHHHLVLYIESPKKDGHAMKIEYSIVALKKSHHHRPKACRPCRYDKLIKLICKSDFAIRGYISSSYSIPNTPYTQAEFVANDVIRQSHEVFVNNLAALYQGTVKIPSGCAWGTGKTKPLLITGDIVPGKGPVVTCFTRDDVWLKLKKVYFKHLCGSFK